MKPDEKEIEHGKRSSEIIVAHIESLLCEEGMDEISDELFYKIAEEINDNYIIVFKD